MAELFTSDDIDSLYENQTANAFSSVDDIEGSLSLTEDEITAKFVGQRDLGDPGLESSAARLALADADTAQEKLNAFQKHFPKGDLQVTPVTGELVFREDPSKPFRKVDAGLTEKFEPLNDIIDFVGSDIGAIIGELAFAKGGGSVIKFLGKMFAGGFTGEVAQQGVQELRDVQEQSIPEIGQQAAEQGGFSALGGAVGVGIGATADVLRGAPVVPLAPGADEAIRAGERLGLKNNLTVGESTDIPLLRMMEGQAGASLPTVRRFINERNIELTEKVTGLTSPAQSMKLISTLAVEDKRARGKILSSLGRSTPKTKLSEGGESLTQGVVEYSKASQGRVKAAFEAAKKIEEPIFDITDLKGEAAEIVSGVRFQKIAKPGEQAATGRAGVSLESSVADIARQIKVADPSLPPVGGSSSVDQLRAWKQALWDAKTPAKGEPFTQQHKAANDLYNKITSVLKDPANTSKEFRAAYKQANQLASDRFDTLEKLLIMRTAREESSDQLAKRLASPNNASNLKTLRATIPAKRFNDFQDSFKLNMLEDSSGITKRLDGFDKETLDILLSREEQMLYRKIGTKIDRLDSLGVKEIVSRQSRVGSAVEELINRGDTASLDLLDDLVKRSGGKDGDLGRQLRAGILQNFSDQVLSKERGVTRVVAKDVTTVIKQIRESGLGKFLTANDMTLFANLDEFLPLIKSTADTGTSIQAAEAAAGARGAISDVLTGQNISGAAFQTIIEHLGVGVAFTKYAHLLRGMGKKGKKSLKPLLGQTVAALTLAGNDKKAFNPEDLEKLEIITGSK